MSKTRMWVWGIIIFLILVVISYYIQQNHVSSAANVTQSAAAINATTDTSDAGIARALNKLNVDLAAVNPTGGAGVAGPLMRKVAHDLHYTDLLLEARVNNVTNTASVASLKILLNDLATQLSNATSQIGAATQVNVTVTQAAIYIQNAYVDLQTAHNDVSTVASALTTIR